MEDVYVAEAARPTKKNKSGTQQWGPSGAPIWTTPTIDAARNALYVTTGDNYSDPPTATSDAFLAMDLDSGKVLWSRQMTSPTPTMCLPAARYYELPGFQRS